MKYENKTYQEVSEIDSEYLHWAYNNSEANKVGIENTTYWKNKLAEEEKERARGRSTDRPGTLTLAVLTH